MRLRPLLAYALLVAAASCGPSATHPAARAVSKPPAQPLKKIASEDDYNAERGEYDALPLDASDRDGRRAGLEQYLVAQLDDALGRNHPEDGYDFFKSALTLYDPLELHGAIDDPRLREAARRVEHAFRKRGAHEEVLTALAVEMLLDHGDPGDKDAQEKRWAEVLSWLRSGGATENELGGAVDGRARVIEDLEKVTQLWPSPFIITQLTQLYLERHDAGSGDALNLKRPRHGNDLRALLQQGPHPSTAYDLARLYLRVSAPERAVAELGKLKPPLSAGDEQVRNLLDKYVSPRANQTDALNVAMMLAQPGHEDIEVAQRVCVDASRRFPKAFEPHLCAGQLATAREQLVIALRHFEAARQLQPTNREIWQQVASLMQRRLAQLVSDENLNIDELRPRLAEVEKFYASAAQQFPGEPLHPTMAGALFEVGRGYFTVGKVDKAMEYLERSVGVEPVPATLELMGQIRSKKLQHKEAAALFERAIAVPKADKPDEVLWRARLRRSLGDELEAMGDASSAETARKSALADWDQMISLGLTPEGRAQAGIERAKLFYQLGDRDQALQSFEAAIDAAPDRAATYSDVMAFLIPRGELDESLDAYHRALGRNEVTEYIKVYCSLWIVDLAQRAHQPVDPLASSYLQTTDGNKWYDDLARWATGRETEQAMMSRADTPAKRAESSFYRGLRLSGEGKLDDARKLWRETVATDMMGFFEYDMAEMFLKLGDAPARPLLKSRPSSSHTSAPKPPPPPDGSI